nr:arylesterase [Caulobacter sp. S45]
MQIRLFPLILAPAMSAVMGAAAAPAPQVVTILGDSITAGLGLTAAEALPAQLQAALAQRGVRAVVRGAGVSGDTTAGGLARVDFSVAPDTRLCVVELGANDYLQSMPPEQTRHNLEAIVRKLKARHIHVLIAGGTTPERTAGSYARAFNVIFPQMAKAEGVALEPDFLAGVQGRPALKQADGLHPNAAGARLIAARLAGYVAKAL